MATRTKAMTDNWIKLTGVTQPEVTEGTKEVKTAPPSVASGLLMIISTGSDAGLEPASLPVALPDLRAPSGVSTGGFVFRVEPGQQQVEVRLDTRQVQERERVRKIKEAIRRSTQG
jgi:hypothetical protein